MMMKPNILNKNPLMFFDRAVNAQRSQLLTVMADAISECRTAADQAAELNETGQVGLLRLAEVWSAIRAKEGMGGLVLEGTEAKILSDVVAQFYAYLSGCMFNDPVGMAIYAELHYMMSSLMLGEGIVIGTDGSRVYTVEGNSGDACKIKSYDLNYQSIKGYGLMNW